MSIVINNPGGGGGSFSQGFPLATNLPNAKYVSVAVNSNTSTGNTDLYTVPANRRAFLAMMGTIGGGGAQNRQLRVKVSGSYYNVTTVLTSPGMFYPIVPFVGEAGDIFSWYQSTATAAGLWLGVIEFDNTSNLKTMKIAGLANGNNTLYTVPALKTAILVGNFMGGMGLVQPGGSQLNGFGFSSIGFSNNASADMTYYANLVPSGNSGNSTTFNLAGSGNTITVSGSTNTPPNGVVGQLGGPLAMNTGDFINVNAAAGTAGQMAWATVIEM